MSDQFSSEAVSEAFRKACYHELQALKPGNVHIHAGGHKLSVEQFQHSADAAAPELGREGVSVGQRMLNAVKATRDAVGTNTNLGIVLLCSPIAQAVLAPGHDSLKGKLEGVLQNLTIQDAIDAYEAIRVAQPGGMGTAQEHDLESVPRITLLEAMRAAEHRDRVAFQFAHNYRDILEFGVPRYHAGVGLWAQEDWAAAYVYMGFLSAFADSLVGRKYGAAVAEALREKAQSFERTFSTCCKGKTELLAFDAALKEQGINPGTSADLTVATLFWVGLEASWAN